MQRQAMGSDAPVPASHATTSSTRASQQPPLAGAQGRPASRDNPPHSLAPAAVASCHASPGSPVRVIRQLSAGRQQHAQPETSGPVPQPKTQRAPLLGQAQPGVTAATAAAGAEPQRSTGGNKAGPHSGRQSEASSSQGKTAGAAAAVAAPSRDTGPSSPEEGVDQCMATLEALFAAPEPGRGGRGASGGGGGSSGNGGGSPRHVVNVEALLAVHRLNTCFIAARSYSHAAELAERAALDKPPTEASASRPGTSSPPDLPSSSTPALQATRSTCLMSALLPMVGSGEPHAVLALNCLTFLACSPRVLALLLTAPAASTPGGGATGGAAAGGLVPLLLGQLRHGRSLEPALVVAALTLVVTLVEADAVHTQGSLLHGHLAGLAGVAALYLGVQGQGQGPGQGQDKAGQISPRCMELSLQLLDVMATTRAGARVICTHAGLAKAMDWAAAHHDLGERFQRRLEAVRRLANMLATDQ